MNVASGMPSTYRFCAMMLIGGKHFRAGWPSGLALAREGRNANTFKYLPGVRESDQ